MTSISGITTWMPSIYAILGVVVTFGLMYLIVKIINNKKIKQIIKGIMFEISLICIICKNGIKI